MGEFVWLRVGTRATRAVCAPRDVLSEAGRFPCCSELHQSLQAARPQAERLHHQLHRDSAAVSAERWVHAQTPFFFSTTPSSFMIIV
jgi:hypothetical protein